MEKSPSLRGLLPVLTATFVAVFVVASPALANHDSDGSEGQGPPQCDPSGPNGGPGSGDNPDRERRLREELERERRNNDDEQRRRDEVLERERRQRELEEELERERQRHNPGPGPVDDPSDEPVPEFSSNVDDPDGSGEPPEGSDCGPGGGPNGGPTPEFGKGFLRQVLKMTATVDFYDEEEQTLTATIDKLMNLKRSFKKKYDDEIDELKDEEAIFKISRKSKLYVNGKRIRSQSDWPTYLDGDEELDSVQIDAKMVRPDKWIEDEEDGFPTMTLTLKKIKIKI